MPSTQVTIGNCGACGHPPEVHVTEELEIEPDDMEWVEYCTTCIAPWTDAAGDFALHTFIEEPDGD